MCMSEIIDLGGGADIRSCHKRDLYIKAKCPISKRLSCGYLVIFEGIIESKVYFEYVCVYVHIRIALTFILDILCISFYRTASVLCYLFSESHIQVLCLLLFVALWKKSQSQLSWPLLVDEILNSSRKTIIVSIASKNSHALVSCV